MDRGDFWNVRIYSVFPMPGSGGYEFLFLGELEAQRCCNALCKVLNEPKFLRPKTFRYRDDFGIEVIVVLEMVGCVLTGKHSDFHKRNIDCQDSQEGIAKKYERELGPTKPGFSGKE